MMECFLKEGEDVSMIDVMECGKPIRNRWQWSWLSETSDDGFSFRTWCKKPAKSGVCLCTVCGKTIVYGSSGKKALKKHANLVDHKKGVRSVQNCTKIAGTSSTTCHTKDGIQDQINENKAIVSLFLAQHCLPLSLASEIVKLAQRLNNPAISSTTMSRQTATYVTSHGVGECVRKSLKSKLEGKFVSLNADEATNNAGNKFLNVIVQYYDDEDKTVRNQLLGTREVNLATAENILGAIGDIMAKMGLTWEQIVSVTMDNCNVMRGKKHGVEALIRELNPSLLDVSGDTIHMVNNALKKFFIPIDKFHDIQSLASDIYYDIEDSPKVRCLFGHIQTMLYGSVKAIIRPISSRFLQMNTVSERLLDRWDAIWVYYSAFLSLDERKNYAGQVKALLDEHQVSAENRAELWKILNLQRKQTKSDASSGRKDRILNALFKHKDKTLLLINLYKGVTEKFMCFIKKY